MDIRACATRGGLKGVALILLRPGALWICVALLVCSAGLGQSASAAKAGTDAGLPTLVDITAAAGIHFEHLFSPDKKYIVDSMSGGVALIDFDRDGWPDIYFTNAPGANLMRTGAKARSSLYHNNRDGTFTDVTEQAGVSYPCWAMGAVVGDYNNDGWPDLLVTCFGGVVLYRNDGNGKFTDVTQQVGLDKDAGWATGAAFGDYDSDGFVDLFVPHYVDLKLDDLPSLGSKVTCTYHEIAVQCGPRGLQGSPDSLYHNDGHGHFIDVSKAAGVDDPTHNFGLTSVWSYFANDGSLELFVANDGEPNYLYRNDGHGVFHDVAYPSGLAVSEEGLEQANMGVAVADYAHSGRQSIAVTHFSEEYTTLFRNDGNMNFTDSSAGAQIVKATAPYVGWGTAFFDLDNDGWTDLIVANGHVYPQVDSKEIGTKYREPKLMFLNQRNGTFRDISRLVGPAVQTLQVSRGLATGDLFNDGHVDVVIENLDGSPLVLRSVGGAKNHWIGLELTGTKSNRLALNARVRVIAGSLVQTSEVLSGGSYLSQNDLRLHFGLGDHATVETIEITWPSGEKEVIPNLAADQFYSVVEGSGGTAGGIGSPEGREALMPGTMLDLWGWRASSRDGKERVISRGAVVFLRSAGVFVFVAGMVLSAKADCTPPVSLRVRVGRPEALADYTKVGQWYFAKGMFACAAQAFQSAVNIDSAAASLQYFLGVSLQKSGQAAMAIERLRESVRLDPKNPVAHLALAEALEANQRADEAEGEWRATLAIDPKSDVALDGLTRDLLKRNDNLGIVTLLDKRDYRTLSPTQSLSLGESLAVLARLEDAKRVLESGLERDPDSLPLGQELAAVLMLANQPGQADKILSGLLRLHPDDEATNVLYLRTLIGEKSDQVPTFAEKLARRWPNAPEVLFLRGQLSFAAGDLAETRLLVGKASSLRPDEPKYHTLLADVDLREGKLAEAREQLELAIARGEANPEVRYKLSQVRQKLGDFKGAEESLQTYKGLRKSTTTKIDTAEAIEKGDQALAAKDAAGAAKFYSQALGLAPDESLISYKLSRAYDKLRDVAKEKEALMRAITLDPNFAEAQNQMGYLLIQEDDLAGAEKYLQAAAKASPSYLIAWMNLAAALAGQGKWEQAQGAVGQMLQIDPGSEAAKRLRQAIQDAQTPR